MARRSSSDVWLVDNTMTSFIAPDAVAWALRPFLRYSTISAADQSASPARMSPVRSAANQWLRAVPANACSFSSAASQFLGVWHPPQWPRPVTRYAPRFHSGDFAGLYLKSPSSKYSAFQTATRDLIFSGNGNLLGGTTWVTGPTVRR